MNHKQYELRLANRIVYVDDQMRPLIRLLNSLNGVETEYSCQGGRRKPYVMFTCEGRGTLKIILDSLMHREGRGITGVGICEVDVAFGGLRYTIRLHHQRYLRPYYQRLKRYLEDR